MTIEITKEDRRRAVESMQRYFDENMEEKIGNVTAGALLNYFLEEIGPLIYNKAVADAQELLGARIMELDIEVYEEAFGFWRKYERERARKKK